MAMGNARQTFVRSVLRNFAPGQTGDGLTESGNLMAATADPGNTLAVSGSVTPA